MSSDKEAPKGALEVVDTIIVGAGFAGLGMGTKLQRKGHGNFLILERAEDVGGTWRDNRYPGAACDVPSHLYSFSFRKNPNWSRAFSPQSEILDYLRATAREEGLLPHIRFGAELLDARWDENSKRWIIRTQRGTFASKVLITATGHLSDLKMPEIRGLDAFEGELFHSADWDDNVKLDGKRIGVVGSGASAIQIVPELAKAAKELVVFQRSAPYITPRHDRAYSEVEKSTFAKLPSKMDELRSEFFWANEARFVERQAVPALLDQVATIALDHMHAQVQDPELRAKLTPNYKIGCKRILKSNDFYPALTRENVHLDVTRIEQVDRNGVLLVDGSRHDLDVLVMATGFEASDLPISYRVTGRDGIILADQWKTGMQAYATTAVHNFPNLFIMNGPNSGLGHNSVVYIIEAQIDYIIGGLQQMETASLATLEVSASAEEEYIRRVEERSEGTIWLTGGCHNWYVDPRNGRLTTLWPDFAHTFREENGVFDPKAYLTELEPREPELAGSEMGR